MGKDPGLFLCRKDVPLGRCAGVGGRINSVERRGQARACVTGLGAVAVCPRRSFIEPCCDESSMNLRRQKRAEAPSLGPRPVQVAVASTTRRVTDREPLVLAGVVPAFWHRWLDVMLRVLRVPWLLLARGARTSVVTESRCAEGHHRHRGYRQGVGNLLPHCVAHLLSLCPKAKPATFNK